MSTKFSWEILVELKAQRHRGTKNTGIKIQYLWKKINYGKWQGGSKEQEYERTGKAGGQEYKRTVEN